MRFWDASAIVPLLLDESRSEDVRALRHQDRDLTVWWASRVECVSALARRAREGTLRSGPYRRARERLRVVFVRADEIDPTDEIRMRSERLLRSHPLRAADALQLSAALTWADDRAQGIEFVCLDTRLREAAAHEGFLVLPS